MSRRGVVLAGLKGSNMAVSSRPVAQPVQPSHLVVGRDRRGFTLVELMIVVTIVGILAVLAVVGYRKLVTESHVSEATNMVSNIRVAQEAYHSEAQQYASISASLTSYYPSSTPTGKVMTAWGGPCGAACGTTVTEWSPLPLHVDGPVLFGYATIAGSAGIGSGPTPASVTVNGSVLTFVANPTTDWYVIAAHCDLDSSGDGIDTTVYSTSWSNQVFIDHEGQ